MRATKLWIAGAVLASSFVLVSYSQSQRQTFQKQKVMHDKLLHAQKILEGISTDDFDLIKRHAQQLKVISLSANWNSNSHSLGRHNIDIVHSLDQIMDAANDQDIRGATLAYMSLTLSCTECHYNPHGKDIALSDQLRDEITVLK
jgi:hypothetical protein